MSTLSEIDPGYKSDISKASKETIHERSQVSSKETHRKQIWTRSCTKVRMQGVAVGHALDLTMLDGYDRLIDELEMFD